MDIPSRRPPRRLVKTYGRGSLLGFLSPLLSFLMASRGMRGWERSSRQDMERDAGEMIRRGYRVVSSDEYTLPVLGIVYYRVVYERPEPAAR